MFFVILDIRMHEAVIGYFNCNTSFIGKIPGRSKSALSFTYRQKKDALILIKHVSLCSMHAWEMLKIVGVFIQDFK